jgi:hypothetical protein
LSIHQNHAYGAASPFLTTLITLLIRQERIPAGALNLRYCLKHRMQLASPKSVGNGTERE